jgi:mono/diheme cytochrome c family protein
MQAPLVYANDPKFEYHPGRWNTAAAMGGAAPGLPADPMARAKAIAAMSRGTLLAWDVVHGKPLWKVEHGFPWNGGTLATAGNLVFQGTYTGLFAAYRATDGKRLWSIETHRGIGAGPMTFTAGGHQYVAVLAGYGGSMGMATDTAFMREKMPHGVILAFKIGGKATLPPHRPIPLDKPQPSNGRFTPEQVATGAKFYGIYCTICHGGPVNPDLRRSALLQSKEAFQQVVIGGSLSQNGMASFAAYMKPEEVEGIRAYLNGQAKALLAADEKKSGK